MYEDVDYILFYVESSHFLSCFKTTRKDIYIYTIIIIYIVIIHKRPVATRWLQIVIVNEK